MTKSFTVLIADDHPSTCEAFARIIDGIPEVGMIYKAKDGNEALTLITRKKPDLSILDLNMPGLTGLQVLENLRQTGLDIPVLIISFRNDAAIVRKAMSLGAMGFFPKETEIEEIEKAVVSVLNGQRYIAPCLMPKLANFTSENWPEFTELELRLLELLAEEYTTGQIADTLCMGERNVERLRSSVILKTQSKTTLGAVLYAVKNGLFEC